jgi:hypothetical protein
LLKGSDRAYSSGSVQDLHLIPFSMLFPIGNSITKTAAKLILFLNMGATLLCFFINMFICWVVDKQQSTVKQ